MSCLQPIRPVSPNHAGKYMRISVTCTSILLKDIPLLLSLTVQPYSAWVISGLRLLCP